MSAPIRVVKMSGAGNDFIVVGADERRRIDDPPDWIRRVCRRGLSVGADGVLFVERVGPDRIRVEFHNPDGVPAFCGNGSRCAARFAILRGLAASPLVLETVAGDIPAEVEGEQVRLRMPPPRDRGETTIDLAGERLSGRRVEAGVPHFVVFVDALAGAPLERWGPAVRRHADFGEAGTNLDLVCPRDDGALGIRTWERGVEGETLACGSGAVAAAHAWRLRGGKATVRLVPASGVVLEVNLSGSVEAPQLATLTGDARVVLEAHLDPEATRGF